MGMFYSRFKSTLSVASFRYVECDSEEVVKVNNTVSGSNDQVIFKTYTANLYSGLGLKHTRTFNFPTVLTDADGGKSVHPKFYFTGDFNGDGKTEILAVSCHYPFGWTNYPTNCYLFDLESNTKLYEGQPFAYNVTFVGTLQSDPYFASQNTDRLCVFDFDGDGKSDICLINDLGTYIYTFNVSGSSYSMQLISSYSDLKKADLNGRELTTGSFNRSYSYNAYGISTGRTAGSFQNHTYSFDATKGNLTSRKDNVKNIQENFTYDNLNRLTGYAGKTAGYDIKGNLTSLSDVGTFQYNTSGKPYAISKVTSPTNAIPLRNQTVTYTSFKRSATIAEGQYTAAFTYNGSGSRVKMELKMNGVKELDRYYLLDCYEIDDRAIGGVKEKLYLGGDFYSAPAVYVKDGSGSWQIHYICRDHLGSITHITNSSGSVVQELSYDAWGKLRNPVNQTAYTPDSEPALFLGRGYTGHEHLTQFGLINMNARLYDPALGRFLSPDPYVQDPLFSQSFNRYSYCLNNPLIYTDPDGEWFWIAAAYFLFFTDAGYQLQKYVSPVAIQVDFKWGTHQKGLGFNVGVGVPKLLSPIAPWREYGATYYWKNWGDYQGWETRQGKETTYFGIWTEGETKYKSESGDDDFSQTVGYKKLGIPGVAGIDVYNDLWGDGGDRFRTSRVRMNLFTGIYLENVLFTEDPGFDWDDREFHDPKKGPNGTYKIKNPYALHPEKYRHGVLSLGVGAISIGIDSEKIRRGIQHFIHDLPFVNSPHFEYVPSKKNKFYFQFGGW